MKRIKSVVCVVLFVMSVTIISSCGPKPDSSGRVFKVNPTKAKKEMYAHLNMLIEDDKEAHQAFYRRSKMYFDDKKYELSIKDIVSALKLAPKEQDYLQQQVIVLMELKQFKKADAVLSKIREENKTLSLKRMEVIAGVKSGRKIDVYKDLSALGLPEGQYLYVKGLKAWAEKDSLTAVHSLEKAKEAGESSEDLLLILEANYHVKGMLEKRVAILKELEKVSRSVITRRVLADYYKSEGLVRKEDSLYRRILRVDPNNEEFVLKRGELLSARNDFEGVVQLLEMSYSKSKDKSDDKLLADAFFKLRRNEEAKKIYENLSPSDTTGEIKNKLSVLKWRKEQTALKKVMATLPSISKDSVNSPAQNAE